MGEPSSWIVEEVLEEDEDGRSATVRISQPTDYDAADPRWPEPKQELVVKGD